MANSLQAPAPSERNSLLMLTGAGASAYLGYPTLGGLKDVIRLGNDSASQTVITTWDSLEAKGGTTFEEVIGRLLNYERASRMLKEDATFRSRLKSLPGATELTDFTRGWFDALTACYRTLVEQFGPTRAHDKKAMATTVDLLIHLARRNTTNTLSVFTTNYDCSYQVIANSTDKVRFATHINSEHPGDFRDYWYYVNRQQAEVDLPTVYIHRLHGCVAWIGTEESAYRVREVFGSASNLQIENHDALHDMRIKLITTDPIGPNPAFSLAFKEFATHLRHCKSVFVWGHSFRDVEVLRTLNQAIVGHRSPSQIVYLDPYLSLEHAQENINSTLIRAPVRIADDIPLCQVPWVIADGHDAVVGKSMDTLAPCKRRRGV